MQKLLYKSAPFLVITFIVCIFFYPVFIKGYVPLPADHLVGVYYPWLDYKWEGFPTGVPVKNPITADVVSFIYPMQTFAIELMQQGKLPLWNPLILTGTPLLANFQSAPFSPLNVVYLFLNHLNGWTLQIIIQPFLACIFLYLLLRFFNLSRLAAIFGSVAYGFSGFMMIWLEWNGHGMVAAFFPLIILLTFKLLETNNLKYGVLLAVSLAAQIFSGYPQIIIYQFLAIGMGLLIVYKMQLFQIKRLFLLGIFYLFGICLAMVQILPGLELVRLSQRGVEVVLLEWSTLSLYSIIRLIAPDYFGNHSTYNYWGPADYTQAVVFSGVVVVTLAGMGLVNFYKKDWVKMSLSWIILSFVLGFENPISAFIHNSGVLASQAASASRIMILSNLGFAILAAFGIESIFNLKLSFKSIFKSILFPGSILLVFLISAFYVLTPVTEIIALRNLVLPIVFFILTIICLLMIKYLDKYKQILTVILLMIAILELFRFGWKFNPFSPRNIVFPETPIISYLKSQPDTFRVNANSVIPINLLMEYGIETVEGYDAVYPLNFAKYVSAINYSAANEPLPGRYGIINNINSNLIDIANVKYILALKRKANGEVSPDGKIEQKYQNKKFRPIFTDKSVVILENTQALPRAMMFYDWEVDSNYDSTMTTLINDFPIDKKLILAKDPGIERSFEATSSVSLSSYKQGKINLTTNKPGILFISDAFFPRWKAYVDGQEGKIFVVNNNFIGVPVSTSGAHVVELKYYPDSFKYGLYISGVSLLALLAILIYSNIIKRK